LNRLSLASNKLVYAAAMFIRVVQGAVDPRRLDDLLALIREQGLPVMRAAPGVHNVYVAGDRASGRATVISTWDTQEQATFTNPPDFLARIQALGVQPDQPAIYEITDQV
jgi:hypothetical protein